MHYQLNTIITDMLIVNKTNILLFLPGFKLVNHLAKLYHFKIYYHYYYHSK